jgi:xanthine dehydrogenase molybdopterin-binding subunit B
MPFRPLARIRKLDLAAAQAAPGITLIMTGDVVARRSVC